MIASTQRARPALPRFDRAPRASTSCADVVAVRLGRLAWIIRCRHVRECPRGAVADAESNPWLATVLAAVIGLMRSSYIFFRAHARRGAQTDIDRAPPQRAATTSTTRSRTRRSDRRVHCTFRPSQRLRRGTAGARRRAQQPRPRPKTSAVRLVSRSASMNSGAVFAVEVMSTAGSAAAARSTRAAPSRRTCTKKAEDHERQQQRTRRTGCARRGCRSSTASVRLPASLSCSRSRRLLTMSTAQASSPAATPASQLSRLTVCDLHEGRARRGDEPEEDEDERPRRGRSSRTDACRRCRTTRRRCRRRRPRAASHCRSG